MKHLRGRASFCVRRSSSGTDSCSEGPLSLGPRSSGTNFQSAPDGLISKSTGTADVPCTIDAACDCIVLLFQSMHLYSPVFIQKFYYWKFLQILQYLIILKPPGISQIFFAFRINPWNPFFLQFCNLGIKFI